MSWRDLFKNFSEKIESLRQLVDVEDERREPQLAVETLFALEQSRAEKLLQKIAKSVDQILSEEIIRTPSGQAFVPERFVVFLNVAEDNQLQGKKREFIQRELAAIILDEARRRAGQYQLTIEQIEIDFRVDATLAPDALRVSGALDDESELTVVTDAEKTVVFGKQAREIFHSEPDSPAEPLYRIEVWQNETHAAIIPVYKREAVIGRGATSVPADVPLNAAGVSRRHAVVEKDETGEFWVTHIGANPTTINGEPLAAKQKIRLQPEQTIEICDFKLRVAGNLEP